MSLVANVIEGCGISTLFVGTVRDIVERVKPPRAVCIDNPVGRTFGRPWAHRRHEELLREVTGLAHAFEKRGRIRDIPGNWKDRSGTSWKEMVRREILRLKNSG